MLVEDDRITMPCPCGVMPIKLYIEVPHAIKWAYVHGGCCGFWEIEFRTHYSKIDSEKCMLLAIDAWNSAPRNEGKI